MADITTDLCVALFAEFRRYDQRVRARQYVDGLLAAEGRKSIANIAAAMGVPGDAQRLHHFVSNAHWEWDPLRRTLIRYLGSAVRSRAWTIGPVSIPKAGRHSVGVGRHFPVDAHQVVNGQQAYGLWLASEHLAAPVSWRLLLSDRWREGRRPGGADEDVCGLLGEARSWGDPSLPVLVDARGLPEEGLLASRHLLGGPPLAVRVSGRVPAVPGHPALAGGRRRPVPVRKVLDTARRLGLAPAADRHRRSTGTATARVRLSGCGPASESVLAFGVWREPHRPPSEVWLTNMRSATPASLLRLTRLPHRSAEGWRTKGADVGLRDFEGRSLRGWHRHMTLASCAYAISTLNATGAVPRHGHPAHRCAEVSA
ncbi:IS701 family transposase [Streptomyces desertarenae]|uniref:IS701 family transposase n=1 Tax=Streptomyces desertarenae TaxID=2666184 RepID=A0ABW4PQD0_9ACTN